MTAQVEREMLGLGKVTVKADAGQDAPPTKEDADAEAQADALADEIEALQGQLAEAGAEDKAEIQGQIEAKQAELKTLNDAGKEDADKQGEDEPDELDKDPALKGKLSDELKAAIAKRIGKEVGKRKGAEEAAEAVKSELEALKAEKAELTAKLDEKELPARAAAAGLHPTLLIESLDTLEQRKDEIARFEAWAIRNADGYEGVNAAGETVTWTKDQIADRRAELAYEASRIIPQAERLIAERQRNDEAIKAVYPDLFKSNTTEAQLLSALLKRVPGLRTLPNIKTIVGDMIAGEKVRVAAARARASERVIRKAPPAPVGSGKAPGRSPLAGKAAGKDISLKDSVVAKSGQGLTDLMEALSEKSTK